MNPLVQTLEEFRLGGTLDSSGRFTLDPVKAREMMERYRLADPSLYVLNLVASAVSGNASFIRVGTSKSQFELLHDGSPPDRETLEGLFSTVLMANKRTLSHFELAIAVNGALALNPRDIVVESCDGLKGVRLLISPKQQKLQEFEASDRKLVRLFIRKQPSFRFWGRPGAEVDEIAVLEEFCSYCPIPIATMSGRVLNRVLHWTPSLALRALTSDIAPPVLFEPPLSTPVVTVEKQEVPYSAVFAVGMLAEQSPGLILVVNGVSFIGEFQAFSDSPVHAVVNLCTAGIHKDVSQAGLLRNDGYEVLMASLKVEVLHTLEQLAGAWDELTPGARMEALPLLDRLAREWSRSGQLHQAASLYHQLLTFRVDRFGEHHQEVLDTFANLSVVNLLLGKADQARKMMLAVAWDLMTTGRYEKGALFFEKVLELHGDQPQGPEFIELLQAYSVCLKQLGRDQQLFKTLERVAQLEKADFCPPCRLCGCIDPRRDVAIEVEGRSTRAYICSRCGSGEFQLGSGDLGTIVGAAVEVGGSHALD